MGIYRSTKEGLLNGQSSLIKEIGREREKRGEPVEFSYRTGSTNTSTRREQTGAVSWAVPADVQPQQQHGLRGCLGAHGGSSVAKC